MMRQLRRGRRKAGQECESPAFASQCVGMPPWILITMNFFYVMMLKYHANFTQKILTKFYFKYQFSTKQKYNNILITSYLFDYVEIFKIYLPYSIFTIPILIKIVIYMKRIFCILVLDQQRGVISLSNNNFYINLI